MAALTAAVYRAQGRTVLYVPPKMSPDGDGHRAIDKDLLRRAESLVIHWTRQIKEMIHQTESVTSHSDGRESRSAAVCSGGRVECPGRAARRDCLLAKTECRSECLARAARRTTDSRDPVRLRKGEVGLSSVASRPASTHRARGECLRRQRAILDVSGATLSATLDGSAGRHPVDRAVHTAHRSADLEFQSIL